MAARRLMASILDELDDGCGARDPGRARKTPHEWGRKTRLDTAPDRKGTVIESAWRPYAWRIARLATTTIVLVLVFAILSRAAGLEARFYVAAAGDSPATWAWRGAGWTTCAVLISLGWAVTGRPGRRGHWSHHVFGLGLGVVPAALWMNVLSFEEIPQHSEYVAMAVTSSAVACGLLLAAIGLASLLIHLGNVDRNPR